MVMKYNQPAVRNAWADTAVPTTDIIDPGNSFVTAGWLQNTIPPARQYFNWGLNWTASAIRFFMQNGISSWSAFETYNLYSIVVYNGIIYQSQQNSNTGNTPPTLARTGTWWAALNSYTISSDLTAYVTQTSLTSQLASYVTTTSLTSTLSNYVTNSSLASTLTSYLTIASAAATYVTQTSLTSQLASYLTKTLAASTYAPLISPALSGIPTAPTAALDTKTTQIATTAFVVGNWSAGVNGYFQLASGLIFQWGNVGSTGGPVSVTFPLTFPHACYSITATSYPSNGTINVSNPASSTTGFTLTNGAAGINTCWMAIGF